MKKYLLIFLISMVPIVELRGAIPIAAAKGLPFGWTYVLAVIGNLLPVPFILWFIPVLFAFMRRHHILVGVVDWLERKAQKGAKKIGRRDEAEPLPQEGGAVDPQAVETQSVEAVETQPAEADAAEAKETEKATKTGTLAAFGLFLFVAIPLPGTGAWTGSLVAALFGMKKSRALITVTLGVLTAGVIMTLASYGVVSAFRFFAK